MALKKISEERMASLRQKMKERVGWKDAELDRISEKNWVMLDGAHKFRHYKMMAEVVQVNDHCELQPKIGDKYVFTAAGLLIPEETTFPAVCLWALAGIYPASLMVQDRILAGLDPNEIWRDRVSCMDLSLGSGGLGQVIFRIYCQQF